MPSLLIGSDTYPDIVLELLPGSLICRTQVLPLFLSLPLFPPFLRTVPTRRNCVLEAVRNPRGRRKDPGFLGWRQPRAVLGTTGVKGKGL